MRRALLCGVALVVVAGCGRAPDVGGPAPELSAFEKRAAQVAQAWQAGGVGDAWTKGFVPLQELTIAPEDGFPSGEMKEAFLHGLYTTRAQLPDQAGNGAVSFPDKTTLQVPLVSALGAMRAMDLGDAGCPGCVNLEVTGAKLGEAKLRTSRGEATVPAWLFTIEGLAQPVARVAVSPEVIKPVPESSVPEWDREGALVSAQDVTAVRETTIEYRLGVGACDKDIKGLVWESPSGDMVVIGGTVTPPGPAEVCTSQLVLHPVQVTVNKPVGEGVILDAVTGNPVLLR